MLEKQYLVNESKLIELLYDSFKLIALESGGVDNWDWYSQSIADFEKDEGELYTLAHEALRTYDILED